MCRRYQGQKVSSEGTEGVVTAHSSPPGSFSSHQLILSGIVNPPGGTGDFSPFQDIHRQWMTSLPSLWHFLKRLGLIWDFQTKQTFFLEKSIGIPDASAAFSRWEVLRMPSSALLVSILIRGSNHGCTPRLPGEAETDPSAWPSSRVRYLRVLGISTSWSPNSGNF